MSVKNRKADILLASQGHLSPSADPFRYWAHCTLSCKCFLHDLLPCFSDTVRPCPWHFLSVPHRTFLPHTACGAKRPLSRLLILGLAMLLWHLLGPAINSDIRSSLHAAVQCPQISITCSLPRFNVVIVVSEAKRSGVLAPCDKGGPCEGRGYEERMRRGPISLSKWQWSMAGGVLSRMGNGTWNDG